jgi:energy-coupling factor transporter ATP-binding protein EcfA2
VGHIEAMAVGHVLPDGRELFADVSFRVGEGARVALVGPNGAGKTTLLRMVAGELAPATGSIARTGGLGVMNQFVGAPTADDRTLADLALSLAPPPVRAAGLRLQGRRGGARRHRAQPGPLRRRRSWRGARRRLHGRGGVRHGVGRGARAAVGEGAAPAHHDAVGRRAEAVRPGAAAARPDEVLLLDEPDNYLDVPGKRWLETRLRESSKSVLYVSHDRELLARTAQQVVTGGGGLGLDPPGGLRVLVRRAGGPHARFDELPPTLGGGAGQAGTAWSSTTR